MKFTTNLLVSLSIAIASLQASAQNSIPDAYRVNLKAQNNKYLSATRSFSAEVAAIVDVPEMDEFFILINENGGALHSGDQVRLFAHSGYVTLNMMTHYLVAAPSPSQSSLFTIVRTTGSGVVTANDKIELTTSSGQFIALNGNGKLTADSYSDNAVLSMTPATVSSGLATAFADHWTAGYNIQVDDSEQGRIGKMLRSAAIVAAIPAIGGTPKITPVPTTNTSATSNSKTSQAPRSLAPAAKTSVSAPKAIAGLPSSLPIGYYKCYVNHTPNVSMAGYFTVKPGNIYLFHGFDSAKRDGTVGTFIYDRTTGKIIWQSGAWQKNNYYGIYSLDKTYGDRIYLIPNGSEYSACKCFLQP